MSYIMQLIQFHCFICCVFDYSFCLLCWRLEGFYRCFWITIDVGTTKWWKNIMKLNAVNFQAIDFIITSRIITERKNYIYRLKIIGAQRVLARLIDDINSNSKNDCNSLKHCRQNATRRIFEIVCVCVMNVNNTTVVVYIHASLMARENNYDNNIEKFIDSVLVLRIWYWITAAFRWGRWSEKNPRDGQRYDYTYESTTDRKKESERIVVTWRVQPSAQQFEIL